MSLHVFYKHFFVHWTLHIKGFRANSREDSRRLIKEGCDTSRQAVTLIPLVEKLVHL